MDLKETVLEVADLDGISPARLVGIAVAVAVSSVFYCIKCSNCLTETGSRIWSVDNSLQPLPQPLGQIPRSQPGSMHQHPQSILDLNRTKSVQAKRAHDKYVDVDVVIISPTALVYRSAQAWKDIYGHRKSGDGSFLKDPNFYIVGPSGPNLLNANETDHARGRRLLSHAFSERGLRDQESLITSYIDLLVERLNDEIPASRDTLDMTRWYNYTTFDIIGDLAFGEPFDCLCESQYHPWVSMVFNSTKVASLMRPLVVYPFLRASTPPQAIGENASSTFCAERGESPPPAGDKDRPA